VLVGDRVLVVNRMPVTVRDGVVGAVITLRDRTELEHLLQELNDVRSLADALRAQQHEFAHRLHILAGLLDAGLYDDAVTLIKKHTLVQQALVESIVGAVGDPTLVGLLLGKAAIAKERGIELHVTEETRLPDRLEDADGLVTIVGNLIDNALESVEPHGGGRVEVTVTEDDDQILVRVRDTGPGVVDELVDEIFTDGFTTKVATRVGRRGLGLALVSQAVRKRGGWITVENDGGAIFTVVLPHAAYPAGIT
jgi:two-component system CitB family sensor kinase